MAYLVLVRHGQTEWNALNRWTGQTDVELTNKGREEARAAARGLQHIVFDTAHTSKLKRAQDTLNEILTALDQTQIQVQQATQLNERNYGLLEGKNKQQISNEYGEEQFTKWRRGWNEPIPEGETLKDVHDRAMPYYEKHILTDLKAGKNVIVAAHGNTLRALVKHIEDIAEDDVAGLEIGTGEVYVYEIEPETGRIITKDIKLAGGKA